MFLVNSRLGLFIVTYLRSTRCRHSLSRSYGAILPSSLMIVISTPEHFLPVYLCRFAVRSLMKLARDFSSQCGFNLTHLFLKIDVPITLQFNNPADFPTGSPFVLSLAIQNPSKPTLLRHPITQTLTSGAGIFNLLSIAYSNWPRLRYRLTLSG